jgi:hypothetical protein
MNKKFFCVAVFLVFALLMIGCSGVSPSTSTGITGNWTMTNSSTAGVTTAKCYIKDSSGSLTISNFRIIDSEHINWSTGYGTFENSKITANVNGSYKNIYGQTVSTVIYFEGTIGSGGISGTGTWLQTYNVAGYIYSYSGNTVFVKG